MARSLRDKYAQKNKGKVSIAGRGTVNRTSYTAAGKKYTVNQKNKVKEDTKKYFTVSRAKDKDYQQSKNSWQDRTKTSTSKIGAKRTTKNLSTANLYEEGKRKQQEESKPKTVNNQQITTGKNKGRYWTDIAGKKKTNQNITPISDPTQSGDYLFVNQTQEKYPGTRKNLLQSQIDSNTQSISDKYKPIQEELKEEKRKANEQYENDREEALNQLHSAQYLGSLAEQNPEMNGAQEAAQEANKNLAQSQRNVATSEAAQKTAHDITSQEQQVNIARKDEIDKSNQEIYKQEAQSGDITQKAKQGEEINDKLNTFEDKEAQKYMTEDEKQIYNALKTTSVGTAHGYYKSIQNELFDRQAQAQYEKDILTDELVANNIAQMDDSPIKDIVQFAYDKGRELQRGGTTAVSALRRWGKDVSNLPAALTGSEDVLYETAIEKYHQYQRADMEGLEAITNDILDSIVYQLPNMGMAAATGGASLAVNTGMVFATSFSSSYTQAIQEGYDADTAQSYAFAQGLSESCTSFLLKGVSLGGKGLIPRIFENKTAGSSLSSMIKHFLGDMGSEGVEEALQEVISTIVGNNILGKNDDINWQNVAYAGVLGSLSAGIMNGAQLSTNPLVREAQLKVRGEKAAEMNAESAQLYRENIDSVMEEAKKQLPENSKNLKALEDLNRDIQRGKDVTDERINEVCDSAMKEARDTAVKDSVDDTVSELESLMRGETVQEQENVAQSQQSENLTQGNENYKVRAVNEQAMKRAESAGENGRHLTDNDIEEYKSTAKNERYAKEKQKKIGNDNPILSSFKAVKDFISQVLKKTNTDNMTNKAYGVVGNKIADMIYYADNNISTYGYYLEISPSDIKHSDIGHSTAKRKGNRDMSVSEMTDIVYNLNDYTTEVLDVTTRKDGRVSAVLGVNTEDGLATVTVIISNNKLSVVPKNIIGHSESSYRSFKDSKIKRAGNFSQTLTDSDISTDVAPKPTKEQSTNPANQNIPQSNSNVKGERTSNVEPNKNRTDTWLGSLGLQLPSSAITKYGSINKISYSKGDVKGERTSNVAENKKIQGTIPDTYKNDIKRGSVYSRITDVTSPTANTENSANSVATPGGYAQDVPIHNEVFNQNIAQPTSNVKGERTSNIAEHAKNARFMTVEGVQKIQELIDSGALDYEVYTDKKAVNEAERSIAQNGVDVVANSFSKKVVNGEQITKTDVAEAQKAFETYIKDGQIDKAMNLLFDMRASATNAGQVAQAFSLIDYATPAGKVQLAEKIMNRLQQGIEQRYKKSGVKLSLNEDLLTKLANAETTEEMELAQTALMADLTEQLPVSVQDRVTAWRYFAMLTNPKTHVRNIVGNLAFVPMIEAKNGIGALLEKTIPKDQRTKAALTPKDKALRDFATEQFEANKDTLSQSNRNDDTQELWNNRKIFGDNKFESFRRATMGLLEIEDMLFKKRAYVSSYAQAMKARGYTAETITDKAKAEIHGYAAQEALKATYQDASKLAQTLNKLSKQSSVGRFVIEGLVPFKKTPVSILKRGIEYSPIGLVRGIYDMATKVKNGEMSATQGIDSISSGLTGVGAMALGAFLMSMGFIEIGSDDDNEETMNKLTGGQSYAIRIGDRTYTIDWMVPTAMPLLTGAYVQRAFENGFDVTDFSECLNAITKMSEPLMETSMLQGLSNAIKYASYGDTDSALVNVAIGAVESYGGQFVPSIANMFARITDDTQRAYYHDKTTGVPDFAQTIFYNAANKIPGVSMLLNPKVDRWGREIHTDTTERLLEATVSPGYYSKDNITDVDNEINRLYSQIGDGGVIPPAPSKYMTVNGERKDFSSEEYVKYQKSLGSNAYSGVESLIKTDAYKDMTDKEKAAAIKIVYDYAKQNAYNEISGDYERDKWVAVVQNKDIDIGTYSGYKTRAKELDDNEELTAAEKKTQKIGLIQGMDDKYKTDMYALEFEDGDTDKVKTIGYATGTMKVPANTFMQYFADGVNNYSADKDEDGKSISGSKKAKVLAYIANMDITDEQKIYFATKIAGYTKIEDVSEINAYASGKGSSGSNGKSSKGRSRRGRGRSSGSSKASKPNFSPLLSIAKKSSSSKTSSPIGNLDFSNSAKLFAQAHDTIVKDTKARELAQIDSNPMYTSAMKNRLKQEIERRYG